MLTFTKLWILLEKRGMKKTDLKEVISSATLAKLGKNEIVSSSIIEKICEFLNCQPGDIMEYISDEQIKETVKEIDISNKVLMQQLKEQGVTEEQFAALFAQAMPAIIKSMYNGEETMSQIFQTGLELKNKEDDK